MEEALIRIMCKKIHNTGKYEIYNLYKNNKLFIIKEYDLVNCPDNNYDRGSC